MESKKASKPHFDHLVDTYYPSQSTFARAMSKPMRIYLGIDATGALLHIGHAVALRTLRHLQEEGHEIILLVGDFTALIGDPSGRDSTRPLLSEKDVVNNLATYKQQVFKILDPAKTQIRFNTEWYNDPKQMGSLNHFLLLGKEFTLSQLSERDMFAERQKNNQSISMMEFIYPMLQAYDSVALNADVEIGGTDQTFNMLRGRDLVKRLLNKEKFVITIKLLHGIDGRKMSKSYNNFVALTESYDEMYGKLMSIPDELIAEYMLLAADIDSTDKRIKKLIKDNPREAKAMMAREVVIMYHGVQKAEIAELTFDRRFKDKRTTAADAQTVIPSASTERMLIDYLVEFKLATSRAEAARLIKQGGVKVDGALIDDHLAVITPHDGMLIGVGKRRLVKVSLK